MEVLYYKCYERLREFELTLIQRRLRGHLLEPLGAGGVVRGQHVHQPLLLPLQTVDLRLQGPVLRLQRLALLLFLRIFICCFRCVFITFLSFLCSHVNLMQVKIQFCKKDQPNSFIFEAGALKSSSR